MDADVKEALRVMKLEEARLRSAALAYSLGIGSQDELKVAAQNYGSAAFHCKQLERERLKNGKGATYTPDEAEMMR